MQGSIYNKADTEPIINGATYVWRGPGSEGERTVEGIILGVTRHTVKGKPDRVEANLYTFERGPLPWHVVEGTESFANWELVASPSKSAADHARGKTTRTRKSAA